MTMPTLRPAWPLATALLSTLLLAVAATAQPSPASPAMARAAAAFAQEAFSALADSFGVPGAVLAVVRGDSVLALEGTGYADLEARRPADPRRTLLRVGSLSKPVTATAVLQLWERGRLGLHADVNRYLERMQIPEAFGMPVTAHALLTHTAGFDERLFGAGARDAAPDLAAYLAATLPPRIYPPGVLHLYSNHGYGLLGVLVEDVTGRPFDDYLDQNVFAPLGMTRSTFRQPPPAALRGELATGYVRTGDGYAPLPFDYVAFAPAGSFTTTAADMARFMAFHLTGRTPEGSGGALADTTRRLMHGPRWQAHPAMDGMGYGFFRLGLGRYPALRHRGGWPGWSAQLVLVPAAGLGLFVAVNSDDGGFIDALLDRFAADVLGGPLPPPDATPPGLAERLSVLTGTYRVARHAHGTFDKLAVLLGLPMPDLRVEALGDTALVLAGAGRRLYEAVPYVFVEPGLSPQRFYFETDASGRAVRLHAESASLERVAWWEAAALHRLLLACCFVIFLSAVAVWLGNRLRRRRRDVSGRLRRARGLAAGASALYLAFAAGLAVALLSLGPQGLFQPFPFWVRALFALPLAAAVLGVLTVPAALLAWRDRLGSPWSRFHYSAVALAAVLMIPVLAYWNLLGFRL